jgi:RNA polymerase sigma-70 factor, ECF subfamily
VAAVNQAIDDALVHWRFAPSEIARDQLTAWLQHRNIATARVTDAVLVYGCMQQHATAWKHVTILLRSLGGAVRKLATDSGFVDDAVARTAARLAQPGSDGQLRMASYGATGPLLGWLRAVLVREAMDMKRERRGSLQGNAKLHAAPAVAATPLDQLLRAELGSVVHRALSDAIDALPAKQRTWVRWRFIDGASIGELATLMGVHRATAARALGELCEQLRNSMARTLTEQHALNGNDIESVMRAVDGDLDGSLRSVLRISTATSHKSA